MEIKFTSDSNTLLLKDIHPVSAKRVPPNWFKNVPNHCIEQMTAKGCMPLLDSINAGYILKLTQDMQIEYNMFDEEHKKRLSRITFASNKKNIAGLEFGPQDSGIQFNEQVHSTKQLDGENGFMANKNGLKFIFKIVNPWIIKTPPGYSCLFIPPLHREFDYFHILPGIVDTDSFKLSINFPFLFNKDKYKSFKKVFKKGTPYVQVIPFKRDKWKMIIGENDGSEKKGQADFKTTIINYYKNKVRTKKEFN
tara:strand:- start:2611 stop:3363 length:753 start_codon:yes stop_codon:yes gene_type:complete